MHFLPANCWIPLISSCSSCKWIVRKCFWQPILNARSSNYFWLLLATMSITTSITNLFCSNPLNIGNGVPSTTSFTRSFTTVHQKGLISIWFWHFASNLFLNLVQWHWFCSLIFHTTLLWPRKCTHSLLFKNTK